MLLEYVFISATIINSDKKLWSRIDNEIQLSAPHSEELL